MWDYCKTEYTFVGDHNEIQLLHDKIEEWLSHPFRKKVVEANGLANIFYGAGLHKRLGSNTKKYPYIDGAVTYIKQVYTDENESYFRQVYTDENESYFHLGTETTGLPVSKIWDAVIEELGLSSVHFAYVAEDLKRQMYKCYNPHSLTIYVKPYIVNIWFHKDPDDYNGIHYVDESEARELLQELLDTEETNLDMLITMCGKQYDEGSGDYIRVYKLEELPPTGSSVSATSLFS